MTAPIFRAEAREAQTTSWLGTIVLIRPVPAVLLTAAAGLIAFAIIAFLVWGESSNKARVTGFLTPTTGLVKTHATQAGVIEKRYVSEGDSVARGTPLLVIADPRANDGPGDIASQVASSLRDRQRSLNEQRDLAGTAHEAELRSLAARRSKLASEAHRLGAEIAAMRSRVDLSNREEERAANLAAQGFVAPSFAERKRDETLDAQIRLSSLERARSAALREESAIEAEGAVARARYQTQLASLDGQKAMLGQERIERGATYRAVVTAPQSGIVASVLVERGQSVAPGAVLLTILPAESKLEAHLFAPSRSVGFVRAGQSVLLRYPAFPSQKFGSQLAHVAAVSRSALPPGEVGYAPADGNRESVYRIRASLDSQQVVAYGKPEPLQAGMLVEADILLDRRRLIEWIFDPLLSLAGRV